MIYLISKQLVKKYFYLEINNMKKNIFKAWITSIAGLIVLGITIFMVFHKDINWQWEGMLGVCVGTVLLLAPQTFEKTFNKIIDKL
jgi:hypothetical protein